MTGIRILLFIYTLLAAAPLLAQEKERDEDEPTQPVRLEIEYGSDNVQFELFPVAGSSLVLYSKKSDLWNRKATHTFERLNQKLDRIWSCTHDLSPDDEYIQAYTEDDYLYMVFANTNPQKYKFLKVNIHTGDAISTIHTLEAIRNIYEFSVLKGRYFLIGTSKRDLKPILLYIDPTPNVVKLLPATYGDESNFSDLQPAPQHQRMDVVLTESNNKISRLQVKSFDINGELLSNHFILQQDNKNLLNAEVTPVDTLSRLLIGTYSTSGLQLSNGFFTSPVASQVVNGEFYSFLQLKNFFKFMTPRREEKTRRREQNRLKEGKQPSNRYRMLLHDLRTTPEGYMLAAEIYYPQRRRNTNFLDPNLYGAQFFRHNLRDDEEYKRTHAVVLGFDKNGVLLWDNAFLLKNLVSSSLTPTVEISSKPDGKIILVYPEDNNIAYQVVNQDKFSDEKKKLDLLTYHEKEKVISTEQLGIIPWYDGNFAAFGFQHIRRISGESQHVYFINKIAF
ncbi:hypothetical protein FVR03_15455 [Pontibacter qinzhouensis]|uniref:Uncharacterized protein n=1 Tax=Pontibacter qinzhouensis TaxID=2603253 RepID=A0A5C8JLA4_9BACT|nr:hypothetical protein [Pontibacter qinzhouensis]TXK37404.1 hypothetical protein FVR03_15455 [Pontibacter qinzhouensis]